MNAARCAGSWTPFAGDKLKIAGTLRPDSSIVAAVHIAPEQPKKSSMTGAVERRWAERREVDAAGCARSMITVACNQLKFARQAHPDAVMREFRTASCHRTAKGELAGGVQQRQAQGVESHTIRRTRA